MTSNADLVARLTATLVTKAEEITMPTTQFDPARPPSVDLDESQPPTPGRGRPPRRWALAAAAAAVIAVATAGVVVLSRDDPGNRAGPGQDVETQPEDPGEPPAPAPADPASEPPPDGALLPTWLPEGMEVWGVEWTVGPASGGEWGRERVQLFGDGAGRALVVRISAGNPGSIPVGETVTVRGQQADMMPAKYFPDTTTELSWQEDATVVADIRGMPVEEALAFLDGLQWRSGDHQEGFDPPEGGSLELLGEAPPHTSQTPTVSVTLDIRSSADAEPGTGQLLDIRTTAATGEQTSAYLMNWFYGGIREDGVAERFEAEFGNLVQSWPDGQSVWIDSLRTVPDRATIERIAESIQPTTSADLAALRDDIRLRLLNLPVVAHVELPSGSLQLHGEGDIWWLCLQPTGSLEVNCGTGDVGANRVGGASSGSTHLNVAVGGTWYVAAVSDAVQPSIQLGSGDEVPGESGADRGWMFTLARPDDGIDEVEVMVANQGQPVQRPA